MKCQHTNTEYRSHHSDSCCSCHISPPCSYCTDQDLHCLDCGEIAEEYESPKFTASAATKPAPRYKTHEERFAELPDGVFGYVSYPNNGWGMAIKGKLPKEGMTRADILSACGICEYGIPHFKQCGNGTFLLTYNYD